MNDDDASAEELVHVAAGIGEGIRLQAELLHQGDVKVAKQRGVSLVSIGGYVAPVLETAAGDNGGKVIVGVPAGITHAGAHKNDRGIEQGGAGLVGLGLELR